MDAGQPHWLSALLDARHGPATFRRLLDEGAPRLQLQERGPRLRYAEAHTFITDRGLGAIVALDEPPSWLCTHSLRFHPGGIDAPDFAESRHDAVVLFDANARPTYAAGSGLFGPTLALVDADGDGRTNEFVYHSPNFVFDDKPFVSVFGLRNGEPWLLFALQFNADADVRVERLSTIIVADQEGDEDDEDDPLRYGGWSFARAESGYNDIVVFETTDGVSRRVARFPYSPKHGRWLYPDLMPSNAIWSRPEDFEFPFWALDGRVFFEPPQPL